MTKPTLTEEQLAKLEELYKFAQGTGEKLQKLDEMSTEIAQKWRQRREARKVTKKQ